MKYGELSLNIFGEKSKVERLIFQNKIFFMYMKIKRGLILLSIYIYIRKKREKKNEREINKVTYDDVNGKNELKMMRRK